jgi:hypothetical protein
MGASTIGSFMIGIMADYFGAIMTLVIAGVGCLATCCYMYLSINSIKKRIMVSLRGKRSVRKYIVKEIHP